MTEPKTRPTFATMTPERRSEIAGQGGREAHRRGVAYAWTAETAREAARRSAEVRRAKRDARLAREAVEAEQACFSFHDVPSKGIEETGAARAIVVTPAAEHYGRRFA